MRSRWHFKLRLGPMPQAIVAVAAIIGAVTVWPSDLAWALFALAALATVLMVNWSFEFKDPDDG